MLNRAKFNRLARFIIKNFGRNSNNMYGFHHGISSLQVAIW